MPVIKQQLTIAARGIRAFLNLEAGVTRAEPVPGPQQESEKGLAARETSARPAAQRGGHLRPENIVWIFGSGRSGSTWLSSMMGDIKGHALWGEPWVGALFGNFYYTSGEGRYKNPQFILGRHRETWLRSIRNLVLDAAAVNFPNLSENQYLIIKEPNGSIGAPLLMEALAESRMVLLIRDPRDVVASSIDARSEGGWHYERNKGRTQRKQRVPTKESIDFAQSRAQQYLRGMGNAKKAYDAHKGPKSLVRYEELRTDTLDTMKRMYMELGVSVNEEQLARVVEEHSWENIPEEKKGDGKFYRKAKPGGWRDDLTPGQAEVIERVTAPLLKELYPEKV